MKDGFDFYTKPLLPASPFADQRDFMAACGQTTDRLNARQASLYADLIKEEYEEWWNSKPGSVDDIDACIDLIVVTIGYMLSHGWDVEGAWHEVIGSNMEKIDPETGMVRRRDDGKIMKPEGWTPPNLAQFIKGE
jgi:predicted HAD superfamily Cof-like phosphohydrolase